MNTIPIRQGRIMRPVTLMLGRYVGAVARDEIDETIAHEFGINSAELKQRDRSECVAHPRMLAMVLHVEGGWNKRQTAKHYGCNEGMVAYALRRLPELMVGHRLFSQHAEAVRRRL